MKKILFRIFMGAVILNIYFSTATGIANQGLAAVQL